MQNILSDFRLYIDTGYFPGAFEFIFLYSLSNSSFNGFFTLLILIATE